MKFGHRFQQVIEQTHPSVSDQVRSRAARVTPRGCRNRPTRWRFIARAPSARRAGSAPPASRVARELARAPAPSRAEGLRRRTRPAADSPRPNPAAPVADDAPSPEHDRFIPFFFFPQFLCYKTLKKCLKNIPEERAAKEDTPEGLTTAETNSGTRGKKELITLTAEQRAFVKTLNDEMKKFNKFFMNAEEDLVMRERALGEKFHALVDKQTGKLVCVNDSEPTSIVTALKETRKAFADFHGELVLLEHWTSLNYTALVKILKKHDKRSRVRLRSPFLVSALQQPFYSTEVLTELIKKTEVRFRKLHELTSEAETAERVTNGERFSEKTAATEKRNKTHTKTFPALARTRAAISCWDGMKDEDSVKRPFGDGHTGILKTAEPASKKVKA
mgnify:FL=1|jgi:hypothetical protein